MASQFDELRLQVSLVDNATAQLKSIKSSLDELGTGSQANNLERLKRETGEVDAALRKMVDTALRGPKAFLDLARSVTVAGVSLGTFGYAAEKTLGTVGALSSKLVELLHISRQTGFDPAVIKQITQAYERSGLSARQAQQEMAGFSSSLADFAQINSKVRQGIEAGFPNQKELLAQFQAMYAAIDRAPDTISKFNTIKEHADAIFEQFKGKGQEPLGKIIRDRILDQFKIPGALNVTDAIKPVTDAMSAHLKRQIASAEEYEKITVRISHNWTTIANAMKFDVMNSGLIKGLKWLDEFMEKWKKAAQASPKSAEDKGRGVASQRPPSAPVTRPQGYTPYSPRSGIPPKPQQLLGDGGVSSGGGGRADMSSIPSLTDALKSLPAGKSEQSNFAGTGWRGLPISTNVDDQRGQNLLETQNDETKTLIGELRRLNAPLAGEERPQGQKYGALAMPGGGRAGIPGASGYPRGGGPPGGNPPGSSGNPPPTTPGGTPPPIPGPYGQPMPPWGATTTGPEAFGGGTGGGVAGGVPGLPGSPSGRALTKAEREAAAGGGGGDQASFLAQHRAGIMKQLEDPHTRERFMRLVESEAGNLGPEGHAAFIQTTIDRWAARGQTVDQGIRNLNSAGKYERYFPKANQGQTPSNDLRQNFNDYLDRTKKGEALFPGATGNASDEPGNRVLSGHRKRGELAGVTRRGRAEEGWINEPDKRDAAFRERLRQSQRGNAPNTNPTASTPQTATGGPGGGISFGIKPFGRNAGKPGSGNMPPEALRNIMEYAGRTAGVNTEIFAGIEPGHHRHGIDRMSGGIGSADVTLRDPTTGQTLDSRKPEDRAKMSAYIEAAASAGATGVGHADDYMTSLGIHIGGGPTASWGAKGKGPNVPPWVRDAHNRGLAKAMSPQQVQQKLAELRKQQSGQVAGPAAPTGTTAPTGQPPAPTATTPPADPATSLYDKLKQLEDAHRASKQKSSFDLKTARERLDRMNAAQKVAGTGDISVKVKQERTRGGSSVLKKVPMNRLTQGDKASPGPSQPTAATGASHDPSLDS